VVIKIASLQKTLPPGSTETEIGSISGKVGKRIDVLEVLPVVPTNSYVYIYIEAERVAEVFGDLIAKDNRRIVVNWSITGGQVLKVTGTNGSGSAAVVGALIVYDEVAV